MIGELDSITLEHEGHLPGRPEMALYGIYEISKFCAVREVCGKSWSRR